MSMPTLYFSCSNCDYHDSDVGFSGLYSYEGMLGLISLSRQLGWCDKCSKVVLVENIPSIKKIEELKEKIASNEQHVNQCRNHIEQNRSWIKKVLKISEDLPSEINDLNFKTYLLKMELEDAQKLIELLVSRKSPPRCLFCGSTNCCPLLTLPKIPDPELHPESSGRFFEVGFTHPQCGGNLLANRTGDRVFGTSKRRIYDTEGIFLYFEDENPAR